MTKRLNVTRGTIFWVLAASFDLVESTPTTFARWQVAFRELAPAMEQFDLDILRTNLVPRLKTLIPKLKKLSPVYAPVAGDILDMLERTAPKETEGS